MEKPTAGRVGVGIEGLDAHLEGGFPEKTVILLSGKPGVGKTLFALNFLFTGAKAGERCCYISLSESQTELLRACESIDALASVKGYLGKNLIIISPGLAIPKAFQDFIDALREYPSMDRLVIDNLNKLLVCAGPYSDRDYWIKLSEIVKNLKEKVRCSLIVYETDEENKDAGVYEASECDGVLKLSLHTSDKYPIRVLSVPKLRYTDIEPGFKKPLHINDKGLKCIDTRGSGRGG